MSDVPTADRVMRAAPEDVPWDAACDVLVVGSGAAGMAAAIAAARQGAQVRLIEKLPTIGGTTAKAGGGRNEIASTWLWICNHPWLAEIGVEDPRGSALQYLARLSRPELYVPDDEHLGLPPDEYALLETFYDHGRRAVEQLNDAGALRLRPLVDTFDYFCDLPENIAPRGRGLFHSMPDGSEGTGADIIADMSEVARQLGVEIRTGMALRGLVIDEDSGTVIGATVTSGAAQLDLVQVRGGVIIAAGGFTRDPDLVRNHLRGPVVGGLAAEGSTGDTVHIATALGLSLANMNEAWFTPLVLDLAPYPVSGAFRLPGDSMIVVNRFGNRVVNEKATYNEMARAFFEWDASAGEYPNLPLVMIYDQSVSQRCRDMPADAPVTEGGGNPLPRVPGEGHEIVARDLPDLVKQIDERLLKLHAVVPGVRLAPDFETRLRRTIDHWNSMAQEGTDLDFGRGSTRGQRARSGAPRIPSPQNPTMHPIASNGPYYAVLLGPGTLDTKGGPQVDRYARMLRSDGSPVDGLYGAGNCIASPARQAYWAGGTTLGLAVTFGWIAGEHAAERVRAEMSWRS